MGAAFYLFCSLIRNMNSFILAEHYGAPSYVTEESVLHFYERLTVCKCFSFDGNYRSAW